MRELVASPRWQDFCRSLAAGLQVALTFFTAEGPLPAGGYREVPGGAAPAAAPGPAGGGRVAWDGWRDLAARVAAAGKPVLALVPGRGAAAAGPLGDGVCFLMEAPNADGPALLAQAAAVAQVLAAFAQALLWAQDSGWAAVERTALRELARLVTGMLHLDRFAARQALDLVLQSLILLTDGLAAWVEEAGSPVAHWGDAAALAPGYTPPAGYRLVAHPLGGDPPRRLKAVVPEDPALATAVESLADHARIVCGVERLHRALQQQVGQILGALASPVLVTDREGRLTFANPPAERVLGSRLEALFRAPVADLIPGLAGPLASVLAGGPAQRGWGLALRRGGQEAHLDWYVAPLVGEGGVGGALVVLEDRTDLRRLERAALEGSRLALAGQLVARLVHEVRNPLAGIQALVHLVRQQLDAGAGAQAAATLAQVAAELERVGALLGDYGALLRPGDGRQAPVDLTPLLQEVAALLAAEGQASGVWVGLRRRGDLTCVCDPAQVRQLCLNLGRNAIQAMAGGGRLRIEAQREGPWVRIAFADQGPGVPAELRERIFEPFFTTRPGGTGLGLWICRTIAQSHGGRLEVQDNPGGGATFVAWLPAAGPAPGRLDVLVVDPDPGARLMLVESLRLAGLAVRGAQNLAEGERLAAALRPRAVVLAAGAADAAAAAERLRAAWAGAAVVLVTGRPEAVDGQALRSLGVRAVLGRPADMAGLVALVRHLEGQVGADPPNGRGEPPPTAKEEV